MRDTLLGLGIIFATLTNVARPRLRNYKLRVGIVALTCAVLAVSFVIFLRQGYFLVGYSPLPTWDWLVLIFSYVILVYFLFVAIKYWVKGGMKSLISKSFQGYNA